MTATCPTCADPGRPIKAHGLCARCYEKRRRAGHFGDYDQESPGIYTGGWVRDGLVMRPVAGRETWWT